MTSRWALGFACAALLGAGCIPPRLVASDAAAGSGGGQDAVEAAPERMGGRMILQITADVNDALWINGTEERLHYSDTNPTIEVGVDSERGRVGLRFPLTLPRGTRITSATLHLRRVDGKIDTESAMTVQVYDSAAVPPFNGAHTHPPEQHDPRGLRGDTVSGFMVCPLAELCASPDVSALVQRAVDRNDTGSGFVGFVITADLGMFSTDGWVAFQDSFNNGEGATLELMYVLP